MAKSESPKDSGSNSSKKVAKAAKAGATPSSGSREDSSGGFRLAMLAVVALGTALVAFSWNGRDAAALSPTFNDHWHVAYGIYDCTIGDFQPPLTDPGFPSHSGIHTHSDGVMHVHPYSSTATGNGATLETFLEATDAQIDDDEALSFTGIENRPALAEGVQCDGEDAILQVASWERGAAEPTVILTEDLGSLRLEGDLQRVVIALAPEGAEIPVPPADALAAAEASSPNVFETTAGIENLDSSLEGAGLFFDDEGNLVDGLGELVLDPETNEPITRESLTEGAEVFAEDADSEEDAEEADE